MDIVGRRIDILRGDMSYEEFADAIYKKTGKAIHPTSLQKYVTGVRTPSQNMLSIIGEYAAKPLSWFFEDTNIRNPEPTRSQQLDKRLRELLSDPEMLVAFKGLEDMTDEEKEGLITYLETMKVRRERKGK